MRQEQLTCLESLEVAMTVASGAAQETGQKFFLASFSV